MLMDIILVLLALNVFGWVLSIGLLIVVIVLQKRIGKLQGYITTLVSNIGELYKVWKTHYE